MIILNKPKDLTSNDCLSIIKKTIHPRKLGHTGTLDKNATGVLICLLGSSTKSQEYLMKNCKKTYKAELLLGISTDTEDMLGKIIDKDIEKLKDLTDEKIREAVKSFVGDYEQTPPMYSSKKVNGQKLLNLARKGISVERKAENIKIYDMDIDDVIDYKYEGYVLKCVNITVTCRKGTYIRTLCKDIGVKLDIPACMGNLCRISSGDFDISHSITLDNIKEKVSDGDYSFVKPCFYNPYATALTFGKFETLHIGHQKIINDTIKYAKNNKILSTVMIVGDNVDTCVLTREQRISKLKYMGVDNILYYPLDEINKKISPNSFIKDILYNQLKTKAIFVGSDCRFGYKGEGDKDLLIRLCSELNIELKIIDKLKIASTDTEISSTLVKSEYEKGNIDLVNMLIGK